MRFVDIEYSPQRNIHVSTGNILDRVQEYAKGVLSLGAFLSRGTLSVQMLEVCIPTVSGRLNTHN